MSDRSRPAPDEDVVALALPAPFDDLPHDVAAPVERWLRAHGVDPRRVCAGRPVERDVVRGSLTFRELADGEVRRRILLPPLEGGVRWPAPFPAAWLRLARQDVARSTPVEVAEEMKMPLG